MMGGAFAGTEGSAGEVILYQGRTFKSYRGMGSLGAMARAVPTATSRKAATTPTPQTGAEGIEGQVPYKGSVVRVIFQMAGGFEGFHALRVRHGAEMRSKAEFVEITSAGMRENHVHDVQITKEVSNYRANNQERRGQATPSPRFAFAMSDSTVSTRPQAASAAGMGFIMVTVLIDACLDRRHHPVLPPSSACSRAAMTSRPWASGGDPGLWRASFFGSPILARSRTDMAAARAADGFCRAGGELLRHGAGLGAVDAGGGAPVLGRHAGQCAVANAYVADISPPEDRAKRFRHAGRDVRPRVHAGPGDRRRAGRHQCLHPSSSPARWRC